MNSKDIYRAIGEIEDSVLEPDAFKEEAMVSGKWKKLLARRSARMVLAASLALILAGVAIFSPLLRGYRGVVYAKDLMDGIEAREVMGKEEDEAFKKGMAEYSIHLFKNSMSLKDSHTNRLISPYSMLLSLAMAANGAEGETKVQIEKILGNIKVEDLNQYLYSFNKKRMDPDTITLANSIWFRDYKDMLLVKDSFLQTNADYYGADAYSAPFDETTRKDINGWVEEHTDGMIKEAIDEIPKDAMLYLINTLFFEATWEKKYEKKDLGDREFINYKGEKRQVSMMYSEETQMIKGKNVVGFMKDYEGEKYSFVALLPSKDLTVEEYINSLTGEDWCNMMANVGNESVRTGIPKFSQEDTILYNEPLVNMGMRNAFDKHLADFSDMATYKNGNLFIGEALQKTFIEVSESGTKAGAVSSVLMEPTSRKIEEEIILDRPFVYAIVEKSTGLPIFLGAINDIL